MVVLVHDIAQNAGKKGSKMQTPILERRVEKQIGQLAAQITVCGVAQNILLILHVKSIATLVLMRLLEMQIAPRQEHGTSHTNKLTTRKKMQSGINKEPKTQNLYGLKIEKDMQKGN